MYTTTLWEQGTVIRMSVSALKLTEVASIFSEDYVINFIWGHSQVGKALGNYAWCWNPHPHMYTSTWWEQGTVIRMFVSALKLTEVASIFSDNDMLIISFGGHSQVGQALGNYAWRWVPHPHMYTSTLWEQGTVIRMSVSALELTEVASIVREDDL